MSSVTPGEPELAFWFRRCERDNAALVPYRATVLQTGRLSRFNGCVGTHSGPQQFPILVVQLAIAIDPLFESEALKSGYSNHATKPFRSFAALEVGIPVTLRKRRTGTALLQFAVDRRERDAHRDYAILRRGRPVTAFMPLRFALAQRFLAAREILFLPSIERLLRVDSFALVVGFFAARFARTFTAPFARTTDVLAESSKSRNPRALAGHWSMTFDSSISTLFNRFRAFFAFITPPEEHPCYHRPPTVGRAQPRARPAPATPDRRWPVLCS